MKWWTEIIAQDFICTWTNKPFHFRYNPLRRVQFSLNGRGWQDAPLVLQEIALRKISEAHP